MLRVVLRELEIEKKKKVNKCDVLRVAERVRNGKKKKKS